MPYRLNVPEGVALVHHVHATHGTPSLLAMRNAAHHALYEAADTTISLREREAMRFPLTVVMQCEVCNSFRVWRDWPGYTGEPVPEEFYEAAARRDLSWPGFTTRERLLIRFVEEFDLRIDSLNENDELWDEMQANFTEPEIGDVVIMAGAWVGFGRGLKALGVGSVCELPAAMSTPNAVLSAQT